MKLSLHNLWVVPTRIILLGPFLLVSIVADVFSKVGEAINNQLPGVQYRD